MIDLRQAEEYGQWMKSLGWLVEEGIFIKKLPIIPGSFIKWQRASWPIDFNKIARLAKNCRALQIKIEPNITNKDRWGEVRKTMSKNGYRLSKNPLLPTRTIWLDLRKSDQQLLMEMHYKTRYNIKKSDEEKINCRIVRGDNVSNLTLKKFYKIYKKNAKEKKFWGLGFKQLKSLIDCFGKKSYLLTVPGYGGLVMLSHNKVAYYSHNAVNKAGKRLLIPSLLTWRAIELAKKIGCTRFDFEGISDRRFQVTKRWQGFSRFKKGFGGKEVGYIGIFVKLFWL